jgi:putative FmdB family regulatory protein
MPRYEYRCRACGSTFEVNRPMAQASAPASCPDGHADTVKLLSTVALAGSGGGGGPAPGGGMGGGVAGGMGGGGGCCGGACGC